MRETYCMNDVLPIPLLPVMKKCSGIPFLITPGRYRIIFIQSSFCPLKFDGLTGLPSSKGVSGNSFGGVASMLGC